MQGDPGSAFIIPVSLYAYCWCTQLYVNEYIWKDCMVNFAFDVWNNQLKLCTELSTLH